MTENSKMLFQNLKALLVAKLQAFKVWNTKRKYSTRQVEETFHQQYLDTQECSVLEIPGANS